MKLSYDRSEDILTIESTETGVIDYAEQVDDFIAHFNHDGRLLVSTSCRKPPGAATPVG